MNSYEIVKNSPTTNLENSLQLDSQIYNTFLNEQGTAAASINLIIKFVKNNFKSLLIWLCLSIIAGIAYYSFAQKQFKSSSTLKISSYSPVMSNASIETAMRQESMENDYRQTQISNIKSLTVADKVFEDSTILDRLINQNKWKREKVINKQYKLSNDNNGSKNEYKFNPNYLRTYLDSINVSPVRDTSLVKVEATSTNALLSRDIVTAHVNAFISTMRSDKQNNILENINFLKKQGDELRDKVSDAERRMSLYAQNNKLFAVSKNEDLITREISRLSDMKSKATEERINTESLINQISNASSEESTVLDDESIKSIIVAYKQTDAEYAVLKSQFTDSYPKVNQLRAKLNAYKTSIIIQRKQALRGLQNKFKGYQDSENEINRKIEDEKTEANKTAKKLVEYNILEREYDSYKDLYQSVLRQIKESQMTGSNSSTNISVTELAFIPDSVSSPKLGLSLILFVFLGLLISTSIAFIRQTIDNSIKSVEEAVNSLKLPLLGVVPTYNVRKNLKANNLEEYTSKESINKEKTINDVKKKETNIEKYLPTHNKKKNSFLALPKIFKKRKNSSIEIKNILNDSSVLEAFRTIRASFFLSSAEKAPKTILVTSAIQGEGKSTFALNFGLSLAQASLKTLIIDTDVRHHQISDFFQIKHKRGLIDFLAGQALLDEIISETKFANLCVINSGSFSPNPADLLSSARMEKLITYLSKTFDHIILDSAPIVPLSDTLSLTKIVDGTILVVRSGVTELAYAKEAIRRIQTVRSPVLGLIVNDISENYQSLYNMYNDYDYENYNGTFLKINGREDTKPVTIKLDKDFESAVGQ